MTMAKIEFQIGERFQCGLITLECIESDFCCDCFFEGEECGAFVPLIGMCKKTSRTDNRNVAFRLVESNDEQ